MSKLDVYQKITVDLKMDELDVTAAENKATYEEIREYVKEHTGLNVSNLYIAQVKRKCGIKERQNYNKPKACLLYTSPPSGRGRYAGNFHLLRSTACRKDFAPLRCTTCNDSGGSKATVKCAIVDPRLSVCSIRKEEPIRQSLSKENRRYFLYGYRHLRMRSQCGVGRDRSLENTQTKERS